MPQPYIDQVPDEAEPADVAEQALDAAPAVEDDSDPEQVTRPGPLPFEVDEFDALEQTQAVPADDEEELR